MIAYTIIPVLGCLVTKCDRVATSDFFNVKVRAALLGVHYILQLTWAWHSPSRETEIVGFRSG